MLSSYLDLYTYISYMFGYGSYFETFNTNNDSIRCLSISFQVFLDMKIFCLLSRQTPLNLKCPHIFLPLFSFLSPVNQPHTWKNIQRFGLIFSIDNLFLTQNFFTAGIFCRRCVLNIILVMKHHLYLNIFVSSCCCCCCCCYKLKKGRN